jgi:hypothetical protein
MARKSLPVARSNHQGKSRASVGGLFLDAIANRNECLPYHLVLIAERRFRAAAEVMARSARHTGPLCFKAGLSFLRFTPRSRPLGGKT